MTPQHTKAALLLVISSAGFVGSEIASTEQIPIGYYLATFVGIAFIVSVVRAWTWFDDRQRNRVVVSEQKTMEAVGRLFDEHQKIHAQEAEVDRLHRDRVEEKLDAIGETLRGLPCATLRRKEDPPCHS